MTQQLAYAGAGSEFAWDTTGQEEAYIWGVYFNITELAQSALNQILAYTPLVPNWAWHGSAYGDGDVSDFSARALLLLSSRASVVPVLI